MSLLLNGSTTHSTNNALSLNHAQISVVLWFWLTSAVHSDFLLIGPGQVRPGLIANAGTAITFWYSWSGGDAVWSFGAIPLNVWHSIAVAYDRGAVGNDPVGRYDARPASPSELVAPSGTVQTPGAGYQIAGGNPAPSGSRVAHVQIFDRLLPADEMDAAVRRPGSVTANLRVWRALWESTETDDLSPNSADETSSAGKATGEDPPESLCRPVTRPSRDYTAYPRQKVRESALLGLSL